MKQNNHLFIGWDTDLDELSNTLEQHGDSISYLKIGSVCVDSVDIERICKMVQGSSVSVCIGGGVAEKTPKSWWNRFKRLKQLSKKWVTAIELPLWVLEDNDLVRVAGDRFQKRVIEIGVKTTCSHPENSVSRFIEGVEIAEKFKPDNIVLEGSLGGDCGIYHNDSLPNILVVDSVMEKIWDASRCIIEWPLKQQQDLWRSIYGKETHVWNIEDFEMLSMPDELNSPEWYWEPLRAFRKRLKNLVENSRFSWDEVTTNHKLNAAIMFAFPEILAIDDETLMRYVEHSLHRDPMRMLMQHLLWNTFVMAGSGMIRLWGGIHIIRSGWVQEE